ncbi:MAG: hypothetical protein AB7U45_03835 [Desulfamplus sp.]
MPELETDILDDEDSDDEKNQNDSSVSSEEEFSDAQKERIKRVSIENLEEDKGLLVEEELDTIEEVSGSDSLQNDSAFLPYPETVTDTRNTTVWEAAQRQYNSTVSLFNNSTFQSLIHFDNEEKQEERRYLKEIQEEEDKRIIEEAPWYKSISASAIAGMSDPLTWAATLGAGVLAVSFGLPALTATVFIGATAAFVNAELRYTSQETMPLLDVVTETAAGAALSAVLHDVPLVKSSIKDDVKSLSAKIKTCFQSSTFSDGGNVEHIAGQTFHKPSNFMQKVSLNSPINKLNFSNINELEELSQTFFRAEHLGDPRLQQGISRFPSIEQHINLQQHKTLEVSASYIENFYTGVLGAELVQQDKALKFLKTELGAPIQLAGGKRKGAKALYDEYANNVWEAIITGSKDTQHDPHVLKSARSLSGRVKEIYDEGVNLGLFKDSELSPEVYSDAMPGFWYGEEEYGPMYYFPRMWNKSKVIERREELQKLFEQAILEEYIQTGEFDNLFEIGSRLRLEKDKVKFHSLSPEERAYAKKKEYKKVLIKEELNEGQKSEAAVPLMDLVREKARSQIDHIISSGDWTDNTHSHASALTNGGGKLQERTVKIHDMLLREYLVTDPAVILQNKGTSMANQVEVLRGIKQAGYVDWEDLCTSTDKILADATKQKKITAKKEIEYRELIRDLPMLITGAYGRFNTVTGARVNIIAKATQAWIHATKLGGVALSCIVDPAVLVYNHGLSRVVQAYKSKTLSFFSGTETAFKVNKNDIHNFGTALEMAVKSESSRIDQGFNIENIAVGKGFNRLARSADKLNEFTFKATGLNAITNMHANITETLFADELMKTLLKSKMTKADLQFLSRHYIPHSKVEMLKEQIVKHSKSYDGLLAPELYKWEDQNAKDIMQMAIQTASYNTVLKPSRGEIPRWMIKYGRFGTMYTSYITSLHQHVTLLMAQGETGRRAATIVSALALATAADYLKSLKRGREYEFSPLRIIEETGVGHIYLKPIIEFGGFLAGVTGIMEHKSLKTGPGMLGSTLTNYSAPLRFVSEIMGTFSERKYVALRSLKSLIPMANFIGIDSYLNQWIDDQTNHNIYIPRRRR